MTLIIALVPKSPSSFFPRLLETRILQRNVIRTTAHSGHRKGELQVHRRGGWGPFKGLIHDLGWKTFSFRSLKHVLEGRLTSSMLMTYAETKANCCSDNSKNHGSWAGSVTSEFENTGIWERIRFPFKLWWAFQIFHQQALNGKCKDPHHTFMSNSYFLPLYRWIKS